MEKIYRILLIAVLAVGILFGLQYFLPITAQYLNIKGVSGIPGLPSMPTVAYQPTIEPLPVTTLDESFPTQTAVFSTVLPIPGAATSTETPQAGATASLTATPTLTPRPAVTLMPATSADRTATATRTLTVATVQVSAAPCDNILFPIKIGQQWVYAVDTQGRSTPLNMTVAAVSGPDARIDISNPNAGIFKETLVTCDNGSILSIPSVIFDNLLGNVAVDYVSGVFVPSQATFEANHWNYAWRGNYRASGTVAVTYQGTNINLVLDKAPLTMDCHTTGTDNAAFGPVAVPAISVPNALKVICTVQAPVTGVVNGFSINGTLTGQTSLWFGLNIGLLKMQIDSATLNALGLSVGIPNVSGQVELLSFHP